MPIVTQKDIAQHLGISRSTVVQALHGIGRVKPETRDLVLQAAKELGYQPNVMARALLTGRTNMLAFWYDLVLDPYTVMMVNRLQLLVPPYSLILTNLGSYEAAKGEQMMEEFPPSTWPVDGIFVLGPGPVAQKNIDYNSASTPIVCLDYEQLPDDLQEKSVDAVIIKMYGGCRDAVRHLVATRKRVAMLAVAPIVETMNSDGTAVDSRTLAYQDALREAGRAPEYISVRLAKPFERHAMRAVIAHVQEHGCPDAIFCASDDQTPGVHLGLSELGLRVPEDVAIIGFDGLPFTEYHVPPLSTIVQPFDEVCDIAWQFMQNRLNAPDIPRQYAEVEMIFLPRASSAPNSTP